MGEILEIAIPWALSTSLLFALVHWDESRLDPGARARAWPVASRRLAIVYFGVFALPVHFGRTRRSVLGVLQGFAWATLVAALDEGVSAGLDGLVSSRHLP